MNDPFEILHDELVRVATAHAMPIRPHVGLPTRSPSSRRRFPRRSLVLAIVLVGASASVGGLALAGTFSQTAEDPQAWVNGQRVALEQAIPPDQSADLAILRRPRVASDALSAQQVSELTNSPTAANGPNPALSREAQGLTGGSAWVIPGDGMICFEYDATAAGGGGTCQPNASITNNDWPVMTGGSGSGGMTSVAGLVPDGVSQVALKLGDGSTETVAVHENVYLATVNGGVASVTYTGPNGTVTLGT
jgi:hypothetical protein